MKNPLVSIVSICWNRKAEILESLSRIFEVDYDNFEVIVVDNNSTDGTSLAIKDAFPSVRLLRTAENIGIAAYNIGFSAASGEYIIILDDDSFPAKYAVGRMVEKFKSDPSLGVAAFDVRNYFKYDEVTGSEPETTKSIANEYLMGFNGAGAGIRRELFASIGYYPGEFFLYCNEQDVSFRVWDAGYKIEFFADCVAYHKFSPINRNSTRAPFYYTRNMFWLIWRHFPLAECARLTIRFVYLCIFHSFEQRTLVYIKAMVNAFVNISKPLAKRKVVSDKVWRKMRVSYELSFTSYR